MTPSHSKGGKWNITDTKANVAEGGASGWLNTIDVNLPTPPISDAGQWNVYHRQDKKWEARDLKTVAMSAAEAQFANNVIGFTLSGMPADQIMVLNGHFVKTSKLVHGKAVYEKIGDVGDDGISCFNGGHGKWLVGKSSDAEEGSSSGFARIDAADLQWPISDADARWQVQNSTTNDWDVQVEAKSVSIDLEGVEAATALKLMTDHISHTNSECPLSKDAIMSIASNRALLADVTKLGGDLNCLKTADGKTAMDLAILDDNSDMKESLLEFGVFGTTPETSKGAVFIDAAKKGDVDTMKIMKEKWQCNPSTAVDSAGKNAMDLASVESSFYRESARGH